MPRRAARPCRVASCRSLVRDDRPCPAHPPSTWSTRPPSPSTVASRDPEYRRNRPVVMARDSSCHWCGAPASHTDECDHLVAVADGGGNDLDNLVRACSACNQRRGRALAAKRQAAQREASA